MHIVRTIVWILLLVALGIFSWANWDPRITVYIWQGIVVDTRLPAIVILAFLLGFVPIWLLHRTSKWQSRRRIATLEAALKNATAAQTPAVSAEPVSPPVTAPATTPPPEDSKPSLP